MKNRRPSSIVLPRAVSHTYILKYEGFNHNTLDNSTVKIFFSHLR